VWNQAHSADRIARSWAKPLNGNEPGLLGYWAFDEVRNCVAIASVTTAAAALNIALGRRQSAHGSLPARATRRAARSDVAHVCLDTRIVIASGTPSPQRRASDLSITFCTKLLVDAKSFEQRTGKRRKARLFVCFFFFFFVLLALFMIFHRLFTETSSSVV
jgi:hypothetical protein